MTQQAVLRSLATAGAWLGFYEGRWRGFNFFCTCTVGLLDAEQQSVEVVLTEMHAADLIAFLDELAAADATWTYPKLWDSQNGEIELSATRGSGGFIEITTVLRDYREGYRPRPGPTLEVDPDEARRMSRQVRSFTGIAEGRRVWHRGGGPLEEFAP